MILEYISGSLMIIGALFVLISSLGIMKFPDLYMRMSSTTKTVTLGSGLILLGTAIFFKETGVVTRAAVIILFVFLTAPVAAHMIGKVAFLQGVKLWEKTKVNEYSKNIAENKDKIKN